MLNIVAGSSLFPWQIFTFVTEMCDSFIPSHLSNVGLYENLSSILKSNPLINLSFHFSEI